MAKRQVRINIESFLEDVRAGLNDNELMHRYGIRAKTLQRVFDKLVATGRVTDDELQNRSPFIDTQAVVEFLGVKSAIEELD